MAIKLIVTDMDETFLRADKTYDKEKADFVFRKLVEKNIVFAIASGNFAPLLESYFSKEILEEIYLAGDDGNIVKNIEGILRTRPLEREDAKAIFDFINKKEGYYPIYSVGDQAYVHGPLNPEAKKQAALYYGDYILIDKFSDIPEDKAIVKVEMYCEHPLEEIKEVMNEIVRSFPGVASVTSGEEWLDVYHKDGGKGEAVKFLQERYSISEEETMCFGDSLNDLSMMQAAKYSMAMENADPELKNSCTYEIGKSADQSVLNVLEELILNNTEDFLEKYKKVSSIVN